MTDKPLPDVDLLRKEVDAIKPVLDAAEDDQARVFRQYTDICNMKDRPQDFQQLRQKGQEAMEAASQDAGHIRRLLVEGQLLIDHLTGLNSVRMGLEAAVGEMPARRSDLMAKVRGLALDRLTLADAARRAESAATSDYPCRRQWVVKLSTRLSAEQARMDRDYRAAISGLVLFEELQVAELATSEALERASSDTRLLTMIRRAQHTRSTPIRK